MATPLPAPFKSADISRFAARAKELEQYKPVISYWCEYFIVNQILSKGLHTESDECMVYTTTLMDKLEKFKADHANDDTVHDDMAAQAFVEKFALDTFNRADGAIRSNKATMQTAQTFQAAATFLDLLGIWQNPLSTEIAAKSKYSKFHALRIAKALRAGEDPNASNPQQEEPIAPPALSPSDPEVQRLNSLRPSVEDGSDHSRPPSFVDKPPSAARSPSIVTDSLPTAASNQPEVSPLESTPDNGYFPTVPTFTSEESAPSLPTAHESASAPDITMTSPGATVAPVSPPPQDFYNAAPPPQPSFPSPVPTQPQMPTNSPAQNHFAPPVPQYQPQPSPQAFIPSPLQNPHYTPSPSIPAPQPQPVPVVQTMPGQYNRDDESVLAAQKHAKWAISALNFEDIDTAVKELRIALRALGAS